MNPKNRDALRARVVKAAEAALAARIYATSIDVLVGIGWLDPGAVDSWRRGQLDCLERAIQANPSRVSEAMKLFHQWADEKGLKPSQTDYVARSARREMLRFSMSGDRAIEMHYRTHWVSQREAARALGRESRSAAGSGGDSAPEQGLDVPPLWRLRRTSDHGGAGTGVSALCRPG